LQNLVRQIGVYDWVAFDGPDHGTPLTLAASLLCYAARECREYEIIFEILLQGILGFLNAHGYANSSRKELLALVSLVRTDPIDESRVVAWFEGRLRAS
jgi:hypothetical protein